MTTAEDKTRIELMGGDNSFQALMEQSRKRLVDRLETSVCVQRKSRYNIVGTGHTKDGKSRDKDKWLLGILIISYFWL